LSLNNAIMLRGPTRLIGRWFEIRLKDNRLEYSSKESSCSRFGSNIRQRWHLPPLVSVTTAVPGRTVDKRNSAL